MSFFIVKRRSNSNKQDIILFAYSRGLNSKRFELKNVSFNIVASYGCYVCQNNCMQISLLIWPFFVVMKGNIRIILSNNQFPYSWQTQ